MQTHEDNDYNAVQQEFMKRLRQRADEAMQAKASMITAGKEGETPHFEYTAKNGVHVKRLPDDEQGVIRCSIGGGEGTPVSCDYFVMRGKPLACLRLLKRAVRALEERM